MSRSVNTHLTTFKWDLYRDVTMVLVSSSGIASLPRGRVPPESVKILSDETERGFFKFIEFAQHNSILSYKKIYSNLQWTWNTQALVGAVMLSCIRTPWSMIPLSCQECFLSCVPKRFNEILTCSYNKKNTGIHPARRLKGAVQQIKSEVLFGAVHWSYQYPSHDVKVTRRQT